MIVIVTEYLSVKEGTSFVLHLASLKKHVSVIVENL